MNANILLDQLGKFYEETFQTQAQADGSALGERPKRIQLKNENGALQDIQVFRQSLPDIEYGIDADGNARPVPCVCLFVAKKWVETVDHEQIKQKYQRKGFLVYAVTCVWDESSDSQGHRDLFMIDWLIERRLMSNPYFAPGFYVDVNSMEMEVDNTDSRPFYQASGSYICYCNVTEPESEFL